MVGIGKRNPWMEFLFSVFARLWRETKRPLIYDEHEEFLICKYSSFEKSAPRGQGASHPVIFVQG